MAMNPWISPDILALIRCKNKLYAKYLKNRDPSIFNEYKKNRHKITHTKRKTKQEYFANLFRNASNSSDTWYYINVLPRKRKRKPTLPQTIKVNGQTFTSTKKICDKMNQHFATIGEKLAAKSINHDHSKNHLNFLGKRYLSSIVLQPTDAYKIIEIISSFNDHKSPGCLDIPIRIIKEAKFLIAEYLANSFNESLIAGIFPDVLKIAQVVPLHKGGSTLKLGNYRPISILSPINKIIETIQHKPLSKFWEKYNLLVNCQFGFRKKHSTNNAITYLNEIILNELDNTKTVCGIFLDLQYTLRIQ